MTGDAHKLMPEDIAKCIPHLYATETATDAIAWVKWFTPDSFWTWYVTEVDPKTRTCFGLVEGHDVEIGYFSLAEIENIRGPLGLPVERDLYFSATPLSQLERELGRER
jgi:hypothetical protein